MALKNKYMIKVVRGNTNLELEADPGESFLVKDIFIYNPASNYITVKIEKTTVGYFRVGGTLGSHLPFPLLKAKHSHDWKTTSNTPGDVTSFAQLANAGGAAVATGNMIGSLSASTTYRRVNQLEQVLRPSRTILGYLAKLGIFKGYPVATGQKLLIEGAAQTGAIQAVVYERYDEGDIKPDMENGSEANTYIFLNYGNCGGNVNKTGDSIYNTSKSPAEFPDFPFGKDVPAGHRISLIGILGSDFAPKENDGTDYILTRYLKLIKEREVLFDEDKNGILFEAIHKTALGNMDMVGEGISLIGNYSDVDGREPLIFPEPLVFNEGEELAVYLTTEKGGSGQNIAIDEHEIALILKVEKIK